MFSPIVRFTRRHGPVTWLLVCVLSLAAAPAAADMVSLRNGDRLSGELVRLADGTLTLRTAHAGELELPAAQVASIATDGPVTLRFRRGGYGTGRLAESSAGTVWLYGVRGVPTGAVRLQEIAEIHPGTDIQRGIRWSGRVNVGAEQRSGNTDTRGLHIDAVAIGRAEEDRIRFTGTFNREFDDDARTEDDFTAFVQHDHFAAEKLFFYTNVKFERDQPADLRLRTTLGTGAGWQAIAGDTTSLSFEAGPAYVNENLQTGSDTDYVAGRWAVHFDQILWGERAVLFHTHEGTVDLGDTGNVFIDSSTGLRFPVGDGFNFTLQADLDWDNDPAPEASTTDKKYLLTVGYSW